MPSLRRTSAGTEICPCAVTLECASAMAIYYHGNERLCYDRTATVTERARVAEN